MKVTLNQANKLRNQLEALDFHPETTFSLRSVEDKPHAVRDQAMKVFEEGLETMTRHNSIVEELRTLIHNKNHEVGVTPIIARVATTQKHLKQVKGLIGENISYGRGHSFRDVMDAIAYNNKIAEADPTKQPAPKVYEVNVIDEDREKELQEFTQDLRREINQLTEQRNQLNHETLIELPEVMVKFLREQRLI